MRANRLQQAFSLVELIIFIVIIGIAATLLGPLTKSISLGADTGNQLVELQAARGQMEQQIGTYSAGSNNPSGLQTITVTVGGGSNTTLTTMVPNTL
ncbi:MAG: prepilin-type N-terminal cleavage/methylation domain-containing protein [Coxiellaceae bacterium]|nr:prepilin-type N-terminal cleavage/methylation domain-containing protein [Coxiellaceae bacterium]